MEKIGEFAARVFLQLKPLLEWAVVNWTVTAGALFILIYWAGRQTRSDRHHL